MWTQHPVGPVELHLWEAKFQFYNEVVELVPGLNLLTIRLVRSYSTLRKDRVGDFGHGWELSMLDFTVQTNGPLGEGEFGGT